MHDEFLVEDRAGAIAELDRDQMERIAQAVPGGAANIQDIQPLSPLQEGMLFHRLLNQKSDTYVLSVAFELESPARIDELILALQNVVDRHEVLRTAVVWERLSRPIQVVCRRAVLHVDDLVLDEGRDAPEALAELLRPRPSPMDLQQAPLLRLEVTRRSHGGKWYSLLRVHHVICDHSSLQLLVAEVMAFLGGRGGELPAPISSHARVVQRTAEHEQGDAQTFFRGLLHDVDEATAPFGLAGVRGDGSQIEEARLVIEPELAQRIRDQARRTQVSVARLFHAAWALVVARTSARDDVVYGTVLSARRRRVEQGNNLGMFVNTLPLRLELTDVTVQQLVRRTSETLDELLRHDQTPLAIAQRCSGIAGTTPLFTALLNYRRSPPELAVEQASAAGIRVIGRGEAWTNYPVTLIVDDLGEGFRLIAQTDRSVDPRRVAQYVQRAMQSLVTALREAPQTPATALQVLPQDELIQVVSGFNATEVSYPLHKLLHELFEEQVERTPHAVAARHGERFLTYKQLNHQANQLARHLREQGAGPDRFVGLCVERGLEMVVGVLAILKAGSAYVPLDPNYPQHRIEYMLQDTAPVAVLTQERLKGRLPASQKIMAVDTQSDEVARRAVTNIGREASGAACTNLAYVIYTSGSTGQPKGVAIEHRSAVNLVCWARAALPVEVFAHTLHSTSLNFDLSVYEYFVPLTTGGSICVVENALEVINEAGELTLINTVPSAIKGILDAGAIPPTTRVVNLAGEALKQDLVERIFARSAVELVCNLYGPSETTTYSTWIAMPRQRGFMGTIGEPIANTQVYVLDQHRQLTPIGVAGEIHIGGVGVARGYLNRAELTSERFLRDPFSADAQARMYKTGDLGRWRADGQLEYLGRNDHQVKVRGFRIELGEIEAQLTRHAQIREAAVVARETANGDKQLVAYVVPRDASDGPQIESLRSHLKSTLPEHMVPSAFVTLVRLPLTQNGKLDRAALPAPDFSAYANPEYKAPRGEREETLAGIWCALLGVERIGRRDNFFALGGHSLLIVQMMERLRRAGLSTQVRDAFDSATFADLAATLVTADDAEHGVPPNLIPPGCSAITPQMLPLVQLEAHHLERIVALVPGGGANVQDIYPLVPLQEGILFHHLLDERRGDTYVLPTVLSVSSRDRLRALVAALQAVVDRHDVLRTAVLWEGLPRPVQVVLRRATVPVEEASLDPDHDLRAQLEDWLRPSRQRMDLRCAPLLRLTTAEHRASGRCYALLQLHHIVSDGQSLRILVSEVMAHLDGRGEQLPPAVPYRTHVAQALALARNEDAEAFFRAKLNAIDEPIAPFGLLDVHGDGSRIAEDRMLLDAESTAQVRAQARRLGVSAATLFHAAWGLVIARTSGRDEVVFGSVLLGRLQGRAGTQRIPGMFINTLPLRLRLHGATVVELVMRTQEALVELLDHEQASLAVAQRCSGVAETTPLFTALLNYRHSAMSTEEEWGRADGIEVLASRGFTNYPITLSVDDMQDVFVLTAHTDRRIDPRRITGYLSVAVRSLVQALDRAPHTNALLLAVLPADEHQLVVDSWNATAAPYDRVKMVHQLFEEQRLRTPQAVAVLHGRQALTYEDLDHQADRLARYLRSRGVGADSVVGICVERSLDLVVGVLAILKAGGAYLPLDPSYPRERLQYMLQDAAPRIVLTQERVRPVLPDTRASLVVLDAPPQQGGVSAQDVPPAMSELSAQNLVYVIYTSGSTGQPKGTAMTHGAMVNLLEWHRRELPLRVDQRVLQFAALSFDVAFQEIFSTLSGGGTLVLLEDWVRRDARALLELLSAQRVERLFVPPLMLQALAECSKATGELPVALRELIAAGEQLKISPDLVDFIERLPGCRLHNHYGPTETHVVTALTLAGDPSGWPAAPSIGHPIANTRIYILNANQQPVPVGVAGEIHIAGANVARGYLHRPELTAGRFTRDPFREDPSERVYKTGDIGRWLADGTIEYLGRNDDQVKVRGFRIELGEIESQLLRHPNVAKAAVLVREDVAGEKRIVAYVTARAGCDVASGELRGHLKAVLPEHMVPSAFVMLNDLPMTPSGKLNRRALPAPEQTAYEARRYEPPQGEVEQDLATIWQELLGVAQVGRDDNFFALGGNSMTSLRLVVRVAEALGVYLTAIAVFQHPVMKQMAGVIDSLRSTPQQSSEGQPEFEEGTIAL